MKAEKTPPTPLPALPKSWSELTWQQLCDMWAVKMRYGGNADVARVAALLKLVGIGVLRAKGEGPKFDEVTGERLYHLSTVNCQLSSVNFRSPQPSSFSITARELSHLAQQAIPWFDYPYGDPGDEEVKDEKGKVIKERRDPVRGYVSPMRDAMILPIDKIKIGFKHFALPGVACNNLTWQQYRALQTIAPQLFAEGVSDETVLDLQAQFLAHCLVPRSIALLDTAGGSIRLRPHYEYRYNAEQAEGLVKWWRKKLLTPNSLPPTLYSVCFQTYQTAVVYYSLAYPLLFSDKGKGDTMHDALQGEVGTVNTIMKYAGYAEQQQVYDSNLPFVLDILNTMAKEAKEIEKMNSKIKKK